MRTLKLILFFLLFFSIQTYCQSGSGTIKYYLEIPDSRNIPSVIVNKDKISLVFSNNTLTNLFKNYEIRNFELAFPGGLSPILQIVYIIDCDPKLIETIMRDYSSFFGKSEEIQPIQLLYLPNDFGGTTNDPNMAQPELDFINAQQAWDISKGDGVNIGNSETALSTHPELIGKITNLSASGPDGHGNQVAILAAGNTDNGASPGFNVASIGFNSHIITSGNQTSLLSALIPIANSGARVINMSWGSCTWFPENIIYAQNIIDQLWNSGVFLVASAGNGAASCPQLGPSAYHYPASLNHVFSVGAVGHKANADSTTDGNRKDILENFNWPNNSYGPYGPFRFTHNDRVDISAPGFDILIANTNASHTLIDGYTHGPGTSYGAPMVAGTVGLMFGANSCLFPDEVESILKLTAVKNDMLPLNLPYQGQMGAGRLNAYAAVDMAKDMALPTGTVEVKDRIIDRWDFNLRTAPYEIKMSNNTVSNNSTINFTARNNIELLSGDYKPTSTGFVDLKINPVNTICNTPIQIPSGSGSSKINNQSFNNPSKLYPNPNKGSFTIMLSQKDLVGITVSVFDLLGKSIYNTTANNTTFDINVPNLPSGLYFVKLSSDNYNETLKFIKE